MKELLDYFRRTCDLVIIDATPVLAASDMSYVAPLCDQVVMVAQGRAPQAVLEGALRALGACGAPASGLIVAR